MGIAQETGHVRVVVPRLRVYAPVVCMIVFLLARGVAIFISRLSERRGRKPPPDDRGNELILAA
jgi:hypothetical protein